MKKHLISILCLTIVFAMGIILWNDPITYTEAEITNELCEQILRKEKVKRQIEFLAIENVDHCIIAGYLLGDKTETRQPGYLIFEAYGKKYEYIKNQSHLSGNITDIKTSIFSSELDRTIKQHLIVISNNENLKEIIVSEGKKILNHYMVSETPFMAVLDYPQNGEYIFVNEDGDIM